MWWAEENRLHLIFDAQERAPFHSGVATDNKGKPVPVQRKSIALTVNIDPSS